MKDQPGICENGLLNSGLSFHITYSRNTGFQVVSEWFSPASNPKTGTVEPVIKDRPIGHKNIRSLKTGGLLSQVQLHCNIEPARNKWSLKTGGLLWQWSQERFHYISV